MSKLESLVLTGPVRIGTNKGTGFVYIGKAEDLDPGRLDADLRAFVRDELLTAARRLDNMSATAKSRGKAESDLDRAVKAYSEWIPIQRREVVGVSDSCDGSKVIIVEGTEKLMDWQTETDVRKIDVERCAKLVEAVVEGELRELYDCYLTLANPGSATKRRQLAYGTALRLEKLIRQDYYGQLTDPGGMIETLQEMALKEYEEGK